MRDQEVAAAVGSGSLRKIIKQGFDKERRDAFFERLDTDTMKAVEGAEAILYKSSWIPFYSYAEKAGVPSVAAMLMPLSRTAAFPTFLQGSGKDRGAIVNSLLVATHRTIRMAGRAEARYEAAPRAAWASAFASSGSGQTHSKAKESPYYTPIAPPFCRVRQTGRQESM